MGLLRWPLVLVLVVMTAASIAPAAATIAAHLDPGQVAHFSVELQMLAVRAGWLEAGLWGAAALFFFVAAIRLIRRTQAFWAWLLGFALYGARWALAQQQAGGLAATFAAVTPQALAPQNLTPESTPVQAGLVAFHLMIGLLILLVDGHDRAHWDRHAHALRPARH